MSFLENVQSPPHRFSPAAFWFWYGELKPERLRQQINMMKEQGVYNAFMHARAYLKTPYLGEDWWKAITACIEESEKIDFYPWLYDEYAWPSGTAGSTFDYGYQEPSKTLAKGECNMSKSLGVRRYSSVEEFLEQKEQQVLCAFCREGGCWQPLEENSQGEVLAFVRQVHAKFVDYLNEETIQEFIQYTHEEYKARYSQYFGGRVPGIFFDEIFMINNMPWTDRFPAEFEKRRGYDLMSKMYALGVEGGEEERQIRVDYYKTVAELYDETFFKQIGDWCKENHLALTGHIEENLIQHPGRQGHFFDNLRHLAIPGADCHDYRYRFPRKITYREPKFSVSVARAYGKERAMSEAMGGAGWGCSLQEFKRGANTLGAMGISMITLHGFYSECENQGEQADWPSSFFFQNPYWRYFRNFADYISRICYINSQGKPVVDVALYYPLTEMQAETVAGAPTGVAVALNSAFNETVNSLIENQIDVDMIDDHSLLRADVSKGRICVGSQNFRILLCPKEMRKSQELEAKLEDFEKAGGVILQYPCEDLPTVVASYLQPDVTVLRGTKDNLYVNHRSIEEKEVYFVANGGPRTRSLTLLLREKGSVQKLSPENGLLKSVSCRVTERGTEAELSLEGDEACWLVVDPSGVACEVSEGTIIEELSVPGKWEFLPIAREMTGVRQLTAQNTVLEIPLAVLASEEHPNGREIRIQNKSDEAGRCGRHLSRWSASWIARRPDWTDDAAKKQLFFRREVQLSEKPSQARICIAAVNEWKLWINGHLVAECTEGRTPATVDMGEFLDAGDNLIAIQVQNPTPLGHFNLLSVDHLPPETMISLLAQAEIVVGDEKMELCSDSSWAVSDQWFEDWELPTFQPQIHPAHSSSCISFGDPVLEGAWLQAWERGCPPLLPWGDLPLFGEYTAYPQRLCYSMVLPAGTKRIFAPSVTGMDTHVTVDGMPARWKNGVCELKVDGNTHQLQIFTTAAGPEDGLHANIKVEMEPFRSSLCDWRLHGLKWYTGFARYRNTLRLDKKPDRYVLNLGQIAFYAEVWVNGKLAGERVWAPYQLEVTDLLQDGENDIVVIVGNSAGVERQYMLVDEGQALGWNRYWNEDNIRREGENLVSGMIGPVQLWRK